MTWAFDPETLPWLDRCYAEIDRYVSDLGSAAPDYDLRAKLIDWLRNGYVVFEGAIEAELIDAYNADIDAVFSEPSRFGVRLNVEGYGTVPARDLPSEAFAHHHLRVMDLHNVSEAGKAIMLHPVLTGFLGHVFRDVVVGMQSLTFVHGTEQHAHQDYPYVVSGIMSHLAATWVALEDVHPDAGPLYYWEGSHTVPGFDWGNGPLLTPESTSDELDFAEFLTERCESGGARRVEFEPRKGDVLFWHAGLVHGGSAVIDETRTRRSFVSHYSTRAAYPSDRRAPSDPPRVFEHNGGLVYGDPLDPGAEGVLRWPRG